MCIFFGVLKMYLLLLWFFLRLLPKMMKVFRVSCGAEMTFIAVVGAEQ
jgi:hypothetical protein